MNNDLERVLGAVESLRNEVAALADRVAALEGGAASVRSASTVEELIPVISAAVAAYLGVKPHIRQIRLISSPAWGQQGRVTIQASHRLEPHHPALH